MPTISADTVYVDARVPPTSIAQSARHCCYRVTGANGKRFRCAIGIRSDFISTALTDWYRLVWATDPHSLDWKEFDTTIVEGDYWVGVNNEPFGTDAIYVASLPQFTLARMTQKVDEWISNALTRPTASGDANYIIGTLAATTGPYSKALPAYDIRAFTVGTGSVEVAFTMGVHPQELGEFFGQAAVDLILEDSAQGQSLRNTFTFHVYPTMNPHGSFGGYVRMNPETQEDANREWNNSSVNSAIKTIYLSAWAQDLVNLDAHIDYHSAPGRAVGGSTPREVWRALGAADSPLNSNYLTALGARSSYIEYESTAMDAIRATLNELYGSQVSVVCEHTHASRASISDWLGWGRDSVLALLDMSENFT